MRCRDRVCSRCRLVPSASAGKSPTVNWESAYRRNRSSHSRRLTTSMALPMTRPPQNSVDDKHKPNQWEDHRYNGCVARIRQVNMRGVCNMYRLRCREPTTSSKSHHLGARFPIQPFPQSTTAGPHPRSSVPGLRPQSAVVFCCDEA